MRGSQRFMRLPLVTELGEVGQVVSVVEFLQDYRDSQSIITEFSGEQFLRPSIKFEAAFDHKMTALD